MKKHKLYCIFIFLFLLTGFLTGCDRHIHDFVLYEEIPATCGDVAYSRWICSCGEENYSYGANPLHHEYEMTNDTSTCTEDGIVTLKCSRCNDIKTYSSSKKGHSFDEGFTVVKEATCSEKGISEGICTRCEEQVQMEIPKKEHDVKNYTKINPSCDREGREGGSYCGFCDAVIEEPKVLEKLEHAYENGECKHCGNLEEYKYEFYKGDTLICSYTVNKNTDLKTLDIKLELEDSEELIGFYSDNIKFDVNSQPFESKAFIALTKITTHIKTVDDFISVDDPNAYVVLDNDINCKGKDLTFISNFDGVLDGNGYRIYNFVFNKNGTMTQHALIGKNSGTIKNIKFDNFVVNLSDSTNNNNVGMGFFVGENNGVIDNVDIKSDSISFTINDSKEKVDCSYTMSILCLNNNINGVIKNCNVEVSSNLILKKYDAWWGASEYRNINYRYGAVCAINKGKISDCITNSVCDISIDNSGDKCYYTVNYDMSNSVGYNEGSISNVYSKGMITFITSNTWSFTRSINIGGISGRNTNYGEIKSCGSETVIRVDSKSDTSNTANNLYLGGVTGQNINNANIEYSYFKNASIYNEEKSPISGGAVGGFVGLNASVIQNCYSAYGEVHVDQQCSTGGFAGKNDDSGSISKSYTSTTVHAQKGYSGGFVGQSLGVLNKCYITANVKNVSGDAVQSLAPNTIIHVIKYKELLTLDFLSDTLYWDDTIFFLSGDVDPLLVYELENIHNMKEEVVAPTCTTIGFTRHYCEDCDLVFFSDETTAEHNLSFVETVDPTCLEEGYDSYQCIDCGTYVKKNIVSSLGHDIDEQVVVDATCETATITYSNFETQKEQIIEDLKNEIYKVYATFINNKYKIVYILNAEDLDEYEGIPLYEATYKSLTTIGSKSEVKCKRCEEVIIEASTIEPHNFREKVIKEETCISCGVMEKVCKYCGYLELILIEKCDHFYKEDLTCSFCNELMFDINDGFTPINTKEDLFNMTYVGNYYLNADIDLEYDEFDPIGEFTHRFEGVLIGNSYKIKNVKLTSGDHSSLIGYNEGVIYGLTIENLLIGGTYEDGAMGVVLYNYGCIIDINIIGDIKVECSYNTYNGEATDVSKEYEVVVGLVCAKNYGKIYGAKVTGSYQAKFDAVAKLNCDSLGVVYKDLMNIASVRQVLTIYNGGICGINHGEIISSSFTPSSLSNKVSSTPVVSVRGKAYSIVYDFDGACCGLNAKGALVESFEGEKMGRTFSDNGLYVNSQELHLSSLEYNEVKEWAVVDGVDGYVGSNQGTFNGE